MSSPASSEVEMANEDDQVQLNIVDDDFTTRASKTKLAAQSSFFAALFKFHPDCHEFKMKSPAESVQVTSDSTLPILEWIHDDEEEALAEHEEFEMVDLTEENVTEILKIAHYLDCPEVVNQCYKYLLLRMDASNALGFWNFAVVYQMKHLEDFVMTYLTYNFASVVKEEEEFLEISDETLAIILKRDDLNMDEESVFRALMTWVEHDKDQRKLHLQDLITCVRIGCSSPQFFDEYVVRHPLIMETLANGSQHQIIMNTWKHYFDEATDEGLDDPELTKPRAPQDVILAIGGWEYDGGPNIIECYDYRANKWVITDLQDPVGPRRGLGAAAIGSKLYLVGGYTGYGDRRTGFFLNLR